MTKCPPSPIRILSKEEAQRRYMKSLRKEQRAEWADQQNWLLWLAGAIATGLTVWWVV